MWSDSNAAGIHNMQRIHKMRTATQAEECSKNPTPNLTQNLKIDLPGNRTTEGSETKVCRTTEGGEFKISKAYLRTEPPKMVSLKLARLS